MEFLKTALGDELYNQVADKLKDNKDIKLANLATGDYVAKDKFDRAETQAVELKTQLETANSTIKGFKDLDVDGLKTGIKEWETKYKADTAILNTKLAETTRLSAIKLAIAKENVFNEKATMALLDIDKVTVREDGTVDGLTDQFTSLRADSKFLFKTGEQTQKYEPNAGETLPSFTKDQISKMSPSEINQNWDNIQKSL